MSSILGLVENSNGIRLLKKWSAGEERPNYYRPMPEAQYKILLMVLNGQEPLTKDFPSIAFPKCNRTPYHPKNIEHKYCPVWGFHNEL